MGLSCLRRVMSLCQHDPVDHRVQAAVTAPAQAVSHTHARRGHEWRSAGVRSELRVVRKALAGGQQPREDACSQRVHAAEAGVGGESRRGESLLVEADVVDMVLHQFEPNRQTAYGRRSVLRGPTAVRRRVP